MRARRAVPALALGVLLLAACGEGTDGSSVASADPSPTATEATAGEDHPLAFRATTTTGAEFDGAALAGQDVVLWFWAPWCTVCRAEAPQVAAAAQRLDGQVQVVGVASGGPLEDMQAFVAETGADFTHVADVAGDVWARFGVVTQPTFVFVDDDGRTQAVAGGISQAALVDAMEQLADA